MKISSIANIITTKIDGSLLTPQSYISTENMIPNCGGILDAASVPTTKVTIFSAEDTLLSNIRPYFKKVWFAKFDGGCSNDVICIRANGVQCLPKYLYYALCTDSFIDLFSASSKGTKMPRGDKNALLDYDIPDRTIDEQQHIVDVLGTLDERIENLELKIQKLLTLSSLDYKKLLLDNAPNTYLSQIATVESGKRPAAKNDQAKDSINIPIIGATEIVGYTSNYLYNEPILVIGRVGTHGIVQPVFTKSWPTDNTLIIKTNYFSFVYNVLKNIDYSTINKGSTQPLITQTDIKNMPIYLPDEKDILDFETKHTMLLIQDYLGQIDKLKQLKQLYLQKFFG